MDALSFILGVGVGAAAVIIVVLWMRLSTVVAKIPELPTAGTAPRRVRERDGFWEHWVVDYGDPDTGVWIRTGPATSGTMTSGSVSVE